MVAEAGASPNVAELREFLAPQFVSWWLPENWSFVAEVPKTSVGKKDKKHLRALYADGRLETVRLPAPGEEGQEHLGLVGQSRRRLRPARHQVGALADEFLSTATSSIQLPQSRGDGTGGNLATAIAGSGLAAAGPAQSENSSPGPSSRRGCEIAAD